MIRLFLALALTLTACATLSASKDSAPDSELKAFVVDPARTIQIVDVVDQTMTDKILKMAYMALESNDPIYIMINSPGGYVSYGELFMQAMEKMQARGVVIKCVADEAASMAMYILNACDERYVLPSAKLLWHPVKAIVSQPISSRLAASLLKELSEIDEHYRIPLRDKLGVDDESFEKYRWEEKWWSAEEIMKYSPGYVRPVSSIEGASWEQPAPNSPFGRIRVQPPRAYTFYSVKPGYPVDGL